MTIKREVLEVIKQHEPIDGYYNVDEMIIALKKAGHTIEEEDYLAKAREGRGKLNLSLEDAHKPIISIFNNYEKHIAHLQNQIKEKG